MERETLEFYYHSTLEKVALYIGDLEKKAMSPSKLAYLVDNGLKSRLRKKYGDNAFFAHSLIGIQNPNLITDVFDYKYTKSFLPSTKDMKHYPNFKRNVKKLNDITRSPLVLDKLEKKAVSLNRVFNLYDKGVAKRIRDTYKPNQVELARKIFDRKYPFPLPRTGEVSKLDPYSRKKLKQYLSDVNKASKEDITL